MSQTNSFYNWLRKQIDRDDYVGDFSRDYSKEKCPYRGNRIKKYWEFLRKKSVPAVVHKSVWLAWREWKTGIRPIVIEQQFQKSLELRNSDGCYIAPTGNWISGKFIPRKGQKCSDSGYVYFFQEQSPDKQIKIGHTRDLETGFSNQERRPYPLLVLGIVENCSKADESKWFAEFADCRIYPDREYFRPTKRLIQAIEKRTTVWTPKQRRSKS